MKNVAPWIDFGLDIAIAYRQATRKKRKSRTIAGLLMLSISGAFVMITIGFGLAAAYWAMIGLGPALACLLTGVIALLIAGAFFGISHKVSKNKNSRN